MNESNVQSVLNQLEQLNKVASSDTTAETTAVHWIEAIRKQKAFLDNRAHPIVFIGSVGIGKYSLIAVAANLLIDEKLTDKASLKKNSVLSIGAGRTTVCEVCIRAPQADKTGKLGLLIEPVKEKEMQKEIAIYAETEWYRRQPVAVKGEGDTEPTPQEIQRVIRNMTDYTEYQKSFTDGEKRRTVDPLDEVIRHFDSSYETFSAHLLERAKLAGRTKKEWWWNESNVGNLQALKTLFEKINHGKEPTAMLPYMMTVVVPYPLPGGTTGLDITLIDTIGLDSPVESRADFYEYMRNQHSIIVLCTPFKDAPDPSLRTLLHTMTGDAELRQAIPRTLLVLIDQGDAEQVNGANGDREFGQDLKIDECLRVLESAGLLDIIDQERIIAFDALQDDRNRLQIAIDNCLVQLRQKEENEQRELIDDAKKFINNATNELRPRFCDDVDEQLKKTMALHLLPSDAPLRDPLDGLYAAIQATRYAAVVYASCRRNGEYSNLN